MRMAAMFNKLPNRGPLLDDQGGGKNSIQILDQWTKVPLMCRLCVTLEVEKI